VTNFESELTLFTAAADATILPLGQATTNKASQEVNLEIVDTITSSKDIKERIDGEYQLLQ